jgi:hypothetical protein
MFILYAIPVGIVAGLLLGGRLDRLRLGPVPLGAAGATGLAIQVALFSDPLAEAVSDCGSADLRRLDAVVLVASSATSTSRASPSSPLGREQPARNPGQRRSHARRSRRDRRDRRDRSGYSNSSLASDRRSRR